MLFQNTEGKGRHEIDFVLNDWSHILHRLVFLSFPLKIREHHLDGEWAPSNKGREKRCFSNSSYVSAQVTDRSSCLNEKALLRSKRKASDP